MDTLTDGLKGFDSVLNRTSPFFFLQKLQVNREKLLYGNQAASIRISKVKIEPKNHKSCYKR